MKQNALKVEVFILGRQRIDQKRKKGWGRGRIEKGSRERIEIERKELRDPPLFEFLDPTLRCSLVSSYKLIECIIKKMSWCETECTES